MSRFLGLGNGADGVLNLSSYTQLKYSCSGSSGSTTLSATGSFSAGDRLFIHQTRGSGVGAYEDNRVVSYTTGTITLAYPLSNTYTNSGSSQAQVLVVKEVSVASGSITLPTWNGDVGGLFVVACTGTVSGTISGSGRGFAGGAARNEYAYYGEGSSGASALSSTGARNGNGGGAGHHDGISSNLHVSGAGGGNGSAGENSQGSYQTTGGLGGSAVGSANLATLFLGGGGGGAAGKPDVVSSTGGAGARGGGIVVIYAKKITATIAVNGATGGSGVGQGDPDASGGGGGAGGSILLKCVETSSSLSASGGSGGGGIASGGDGGVGRIRIESCSTSASATPTASLDTGGHSYCGSGAFIL